jgi:UDP-N-acetylglucosamine 3-dehydrogenase
VEHRADCAEFFLDYGDVTGYVQANWITPVKIRVLTITGSDGYIEMDYINQKVQLYRSNYEKLREPDGPYSFGDYVLRFSEPEVAGVAVARREPLKEELDAFFSAVRAGASHDCRHAIDALHIALGGSFTSPRSSL